MRPVQTLKAIEGQLTVISKTTTSAKEVYKTTAIQASSKRI